MKHVCAALCMLILCVATGHAGWATLSSCPVGIYEGGAIAYATFPLTSNLDTIYVMAGDNPNNGKYFYRYDASANSWTRTADVPEEVDADYGGAMAFAPAPYGYHRIYALVGEDGLYYFRHTGTTGGYQGTWTNSGETFSHSTGCAISWGGTGARNTIAGAFLFAFRGGASDDFYRFFYSTPQTLNPTLVTALDEKAGFGYDVTHGALTWDPYTSTHGSELYGIGYEDDTEFRGYDTTNNSWASLESPWASHGGGVALAALTMTGTSNSVYALRGDQRDNFRSYSVSGDDWNSETDAPWDVGVGGGLTYCAKNAYLYATRGDGTGDFARFDPYSEDQDGGQDAGGAPVAKAVVSCRPTGRGGYQLSCPLADGIEVAFLVRDVSGRTVASIPSREGRVDWCPQSTGVYLVTVAGSGLYGAGRLTVVR